MYNFKAMKKILFLLLFTFFSVASQFSWPLFPFTALTSNFYEYRTTHFHGGVDLSTYRKEGLPVRAAEAGEIFRIFYGWYGFGKAVYIRHSGGYVTVYGHLRKFENKVLGLEDLIKKSARAKGTKYLGTCYLKRTIKVKKGQIIGYSGAMGAGGPHLHFEIRKGEMEPLNPLFFLNAPIGKVVFGKFILEIADSGSFVGMRPTRFHGRFRKIGKIYRYEQIPVHGCFRFFLEAYEKCKGRCGVYSIEAYLDGKRIFHYKGEKFTFSENYLAGRIFNIAISSTKAPFYSIPEFGSPPICIRKGRHSLTIKGINEHGKVSVASLKLVHVLPPYKNGKINTKLLKKVMVKRGEDWEKTNLDKIKNGEVFKVKASWGKYISPWIVLEKGEALDSRETVEPLGVEEHIGWEKIYVDNTFASFPLYCNNRCFLVLSPREKGRVMKNGFSIVVDDSVSDAEFSIKKGSFPGVKKASITKAKLSLPDGVIPVSPFFIITPQEALLRYNGKVKIKIPEGSEPNRVGIFRKFGNGWAFLGGDREGQYWTANTKLLGGFVLARDILPPKIKKVRLCRWGIRAVIKDNGSGVNPPKIEFVLDGRKYIPDYDYDSGRAFLDIEIPLGWHILIIKAQDFVKNKTSVGYRLKVI